jgi:(1->4)-alpha-D-glucan 1-alpha-D-glucosylmutase
LLKITVPGIPDFYQGSEVWDFRLVDPDNREPVDYEKRQMLLTWLQQAAAQKSPAELAQELKDTITDGRLKLFVIHKALDLRSRRPMLFSDGSYVPLRPEGLRKRNIVAFAREHGNEALLMVVGRFFMDFPADQINVSAPWSDTRIELPDFAEKAVWRDIYTQRRFENPSSLSVAEIFAQYPFACLERVTE